MNLLLYLAEAIAIAYLMRQLSAKMKMPSVTGYVMGGILLGGSFLFFSPSLQRWMQPFLLTPDVLDRLGLASEIALGMIAFSIGAELHLSRIRKFGRSIIAIVLLEGLGSFFCVSLVVYWIVPDRPYMALMLGAVASATAPAATVAVINQYRSRGPLTTTILAVVGIDDAMALIIYAFASAVAKASIRGTSIDLVSGFLTPFVGVVLSLLLGALVALFLLRFFRRARQPEDLMLLTAVLILTTTGAATQFDLSPLLANMAGAAVLVNRFASIKYRIQKVLPGLTILLYSLFFVTAGAHLDVSLLPKIGLLGLGYFLARLVGKVGGAYFGAVLGRAGKTVRKHIGFSLIPQVGVAVALALVVGKEFGTGAYGPPGVELATTVINILLFTTILTEIIGPYMTRVALQRAGEARTAD